ncbi:MAG: beta-ketoacyl-ACP synthase III [Desulfocurvibacter africanus]
MSQAAYITDVSAFLPGEPVSNEDMEKVLGLVGESASRVRRIILRSNKIQSRHYALDPATREQTHSNAQLAAEAVRRLAPYAGYLPADIQCLACGTSSPDQLLPGHGLMVHGELATGPCEVVSPAGICLAGIGALKYAYMNVALGLTENAVATGSELSSTFLRAEFCEPAACDRSEELQKAPILAFEADFLRWMLSDGAGAVFVTNAPRPDGLSLRIDWIEHVSFAGSLPTCMYAGGEKREDGSLVGWRSLVSRGQNVDKSLLLVRQDVKMLNAEVVVTAVDRTLPLVIGRRGIKPEDVDWFLPHISSEFFRPQLAERMEAFGFHIPQERWFTNLSSRGNTGSASIFIMLAELFRSGRIEKGQKILCFIPESGRFSMSYMLLTAV